MNIDLALLWRTYHVGISLFALTVALAAAIMLVPWLYDKTR